MSTPTIGVVIPTRNRVVQLKTAIRSVLAQTTPVDQVVIVDEASTDSTPAFLAELVSSDPRFTFVRHETPAFLPTARNVGISHLETELVAFLDDDDAWDPRKLAVQTQAMSLGGEAWAASSALLFSGGWHAVRAQRVPSTVGFNSRLLRANCIPAGGSTVVARRADVERVGGFDAKATYMEDWECWIALTRLLGPPALVDEPLTAYRIQPNQMSSVTDDLMASYRYVAAKHADFSERAGQPMDSSSLREFAAGRMLNSGRSADARHVYAGLFNERPSLRWLAKWAFAQMPSAAIALSDWRFRRGVPSAWLASVDGWLTQLMKLEAREEFAEKP